MFKTERTADKYTHGFRGGWFGDSNVEKQTQRASKTCKSQSSQSKLPETGWYDSKSDPHHTCIGKNQALSYEDVERNLGVGIMRLKAGRESLQSLLGNTRRQAGPVRKQSDLHSKQLTQHH
jgi:hypothetical protein